MVDFASSGRFHAGQDAADGEGQLLLPNNEDQPVVRVGLRLVVLDGHAIVVVAVMVGLEEPDFLEAARAVFGEVPGDLPQPCG